MQVRPNRVIDVTMTLTDMDDNTLIDDDYARRPYSFFFGGGEMLAQFEQALKGHRVGDVFDVQIEEAYGVYNSQMVQKVDRTKLPEDIQEGMALTMQIPGIPNPMVFRVKRLTTTLAHLDGNHPMAGLNIRYRGVIVGVRPPTEEELSQQRALPSSARANTAQSSADVCPPLDSGTG